jgi:hypothetical protein
MDRDEPLAEIKAFGQRKRGKKQLRIDEARKLVDLCIRKAIEFGKTERSRRTLEVPARLRPYLLALAKGRAPNAQLISRTISRRSGKKRDRYWLLYHAATWTAIPSCAWSAATRRRQRHR